MYDLSLSVFLLTYKEAPVKGNGQPIVKSGPNISQDSSASQYLESKEFNVISLANNHAMDYGEDGFNDTCKAFMTHY